MTTWPLSWTDSYVNLLQSGADLNLQTSTCSVDTLLIMYSMLPTFPTILIRACMCCSKHPQDNDSYHVLMVVFRGITSLIRLIAETSYLYNYA